MDSPPRGPRLHATREHRPVNKFDTSFSFFPNVIVRSIFFSDCNVLGSRTQNQPPTTHPLLFFLFPKQRFHHHPPQIATIMHPHVFVGKDTRPRPPRASSPALTVRLDPFQLRVQQQIGVITMVSLLAPNRGFLPETRQKPGNNHATRNPPHGTDVRLGRVCAQIPNKRTSLPDFPSPRPAIIAAAQQNLPLFFLLFYLAVTAVLAPLPTS